MALVEGFSHYILKKFPIMLKKFEAFQAGISVKDVAVWKSVKNQYIKNVR